MTTYEYILEIRDKATMTMRNVQSIAGKTYTDIQQKQEKLNRSTEQFGGLIKRVFTGYLLYQGGRAILKLGVDMEQTRISFETFIGSAERANKLIMDLQEWGKITPLKDTDLYEGAKMLLNFGRNVNDVMPDIKMLTDVAGANAEKFNSLTLAYSQVMSAGKLQGQDLLQMINAGFNPLLEISNKTGVSMAVLRKQMEKGAISSEMVTKAFKTATSEGGRFFQMALRQSKTVGGLWSTALSNMQKSALNLFEKLRPKLTELITKLVSLTDWLSKNLDIIIRYAVPLATFVGGIWALNKALTAARTASLLLNSSLTVNPYVALIASIGTLIIYYQRLKKAREEAIPNMMNEVAEGSRESIINRYTGLFNNLVKNSNADDAYDKVKKQITEDIENEKKNFHAPITYVDEPSWFGRWILGRKPTYRIEDSTQQIKRNVESMQTALSEIENLHNQAQIKKMNSEDTYKDLLKGISDNSKPQIITINIGKLQDQTVINSQNLTEGVSQVEVMLTEMFLRVANSANRLR